MRIYPTIFKKTIHETQDGEIALCRNSKGQLFRDDSLPCVQVKKGKKTDGYHEIQPGKKVNKPVPASLTLPKDDGVVAFTHGEYPVCGGFTINQKADGTAAGNELNRYMQVDNDSIFGYNTVNAEGKQHSFDDQPSVFARFKRGGREYKSWKQNGVLHRTTGPAFLPTPENPRYYLFGKEMSKETWEKEVAKMKAEGTA